MLTKCGFIIREIRKHVVMIALMRQHMRERNRVIGLIGRTRKNPDVLENPSGNENKSCKSDKGNAGLEGLRVKRDRAVESTGTSESYEGTRPKICRKRSFRGSDYEEHRKRKAPVLHQGRKRGVLSSIYSRSQKCMRKDINKHPSLEPEILPGTSNQGQTRRSNPSKQRSSRKTRVESDRTRETRPSTNRRHSATEVIPVLSRRKPTVETLSVLSKAPLQRTRRTTGGAEEYGD
ncbi:hypothetical protein TNCV_3123681 [Trichonephila clavipes]|nr:hypothetical protein TNCV_3123681 [Trichonephila clavipes]